MKVLALPVLILACAASAQAASVNVYLADLAVGGPGTPFGTEANDPTTTGHVGPSAGASAAPGFGSSSFSASVNTTTNNKYSNFRVNGSALGSAITVADLDNFSYWTNTSGQLDWRISIYTKRTAIPGGNYNAITNPDGNLGSFYKSRIQAFPTSDNNSLWNQLSAGGLSFGETNLNGGSQSTPWSWEAVQAGTVAAANGNFRDFRTEEILFIDFTLGANSGGGISQGDLDGIVFNIGSTTLSLNLEAVIPLPASSLMGLGLLSAGILGRRR